MNQDMVRGFSDEMESIVKTSGGVLKEVGSRIVNTLRSAPEAASLALRSAPSAIASYTYKAPNSIASNIANTVRGFKNPIANASEGLRESIKWAPGNRLNSAMFVGGTALGVPGVVKKEDPTGEGRSRLRRAATFAGETAGGLVGFKHGLSGNIAGTLLGHAAGSMAGKGIDKARGYKPPRGAKQRDLYPTVRAEAPISMVSQLPNET